MSHLCLHQQNDVEDFRRLNWLHCKRRGDCNYEEQTMQRCTPRHADWRQAIEAFYMVAGSSGAVEPMVPCKNGTVSLTAAGSV